MYPRMCLIGGLAPFTALGAALTHCTRLQCFRIGLESFWNPLRDPLCHCEANLPPTLLVFVIHIGVFTSRSWKRFCAGAVSFDVVGRLLSPPGDKFPHLQRAELHIPQGVGSKYGKPTKEPRPMPLLRLKDAGLLHVNVAYNVERYGRGE